MNYYEHVAQLPDNLHEIHEYCFDITGRPNFEYSYQIALGRLCAISDHWDEFKRNCDQFFFNKEGVDPLHLNLAWHCYVKGMTVLVAKLEKQNV